MGCRENLLTATKVTLLMGSPTGKEGGSRCPWSKEGIENKNRNFMKKDGTLLVKDKDCAFGTPGLKKEKW